MQRYLASELPNQAAKQSRQTPHGGQSAPMPQAVQHAIALGSYVLEQRGREGATLYVQGLQQVLSQALIEPICRALQITMPQRVQHAPEKEREEQKPQQPPQKSRSEPDMETLFKLIQMMKGKDSGDLSALFQFMGGMGKKT